MKSFKYFDLNNNGTVEPEEFAKAIEKIGIMIPTKQVTYPYKISTYQAEIRTSSGFRTTIALKILFNFILQDLDALFNLYDKDRNGCLDYKEFSGALFNKEVGSGSPTKGGASSGPEELVERLRTKLASRGARGIIGLGKQFRIMDDNNSRNLDLYEFTKAVKDYMLGFSDNEIKVLFSYFDSDRGGAVDYDEFIRILRGPMNPARKRFVAQAYAKLDKDGSGYIDINDIKGVYSAKTHPDVLAGKKTEEQILLEFLETFETHHSLRNNNAPDHVVTKEEFEEYYNNVSASVDNDQYFELMMNNAWKINDGAKNYGKSWANKDEAGPAKGGPASRGGATAVGTAAGQRIGTAQAPQTYSRPQTGAGRQPASSGFNIGMGSQSQQAKPSQSAAQSQSAEPQLSYSEQQLMDQFRTKLAARGARGLMGLAKQFKIADDNNSKNLDMYEFQKAIKDFRIGLNEKDSERLFRIFDRDRSGSIDYEEFLRGVRGEMNQFRVTLCKKAFNIMDKDRSGILNLDDIKQTYNAKLHPDVKSGKKTEDDVLLEFLDTFEMHYSFSHENSRDGRISMDEWIEYYNNVSMSIDDDKYFELMMNSAWNFDNSRVAKKGWGGEF